MNSAPGTQAPSFRPRPNGIYLVKGLEGAGTAERNLTLILSQDGTAALMTEYVGLGTSIERGIWVDHDARVDITWNELDGKAIHLRMSFELRGNEMTYVGPDPNAFGLFGVRFQRAIPLA